MLPLMTMGGVFSGEQRAGSIVARRDGARSAVGRRCRWLQSNAGTGYDPMEYLARGRCVFHPVIVGVQFL